MTEPRGARSALVPGCPRCGATLDISRMAPGEQACPACGRSFLATPFSPPEPRPEIVPRLAEAGPEGGIPCGRHAGNRAVANCSRCGIFMCSLCRIEIDGMELCPACFDRLSSEGVLSSSRTRLRDYRGIALALGFAGCFLYFIGLITGPATLYFTWRGLKQRRELGDRGGLVSLTLAVLLGLFQIGGSIFLIYAIVTELGASS